MAIALLDGLIGALKARVLPLTSTPADGALLVNPPLNEADAGFVVLACEADDGTASGTRDVRAIDISSDYRMRTGVDSLMFNAKFPGTALDTGRWNQILTTMTATVANGIANLNAGL